VLAIVWNLVGLSLCSLMPGAGFATVEDLLATTLWFVLWSFLGLLILPTPSRAGVYECDRGALEAGVARGTLEETIRALDRLQEDEPGRPAGIERIFHPVPSVANRLAGLDAASAPRGAWHGARTTLYLSWACLGLLARAVHCNCGRPQLWVLFPGD
jgi:Zn-dependent protease with chaperone function